MTSLAVNSASDGFVLSVTALITFPYCAIGIIAFLLIPPARCVALFLRRVAPCISIVAGIFRMAALVLWNTSPPLLQRAARYIAVAAKKSSQASSGAVIGFVLTIIFIALYLALAILAAFLSFGRRQYGARCAAAAIECASAGSRAPFVSAACLAVSFLAAAAAAVIVTAAMVPAACFLLVAGIAHGLRFSAAWCPLRLTAWSIPAAEEEGKSEDPAGLWKSCAPWLSPLLFPIRSCADAAWASLGYAASFASAAMDAAAAAVLCALLFAPATVCPAVRNALLRSGAGGCRSVIMAASALFLVAAHPVAAAADILAAVFSSGNALPVASFAGAAAAVVGPMPSPALDGICRNGLAAACILMGVAAMVSSSRGLESQLPLMYLPVLVSTIRKQPR